MAFELRKVDALVDNNVTEHDTDVVSHSTERRDVSIVDSIDNSADICVILSQNP